MEQESFSSAVNLAAAATLGAWVPTMPRFSFSTGWMGCFMVGWEFGVGILEGLGGDRGHFRGLLVGALGCLLFGILNGKEDGARIGLFGKPN